MYGSKTCITAAAGRRRVFDEPDNLSALQYLKVLLFLLNPIELFQSLLSQNCHGHLLLGLLPTDHVHVFIVPNSYFHDHASPEAPNHHPEVQVAGWHNDQ